MQFGNKTIIIYNKSIIIIFVGNNYFCKILFKHSLKTHSVYIMLSNEKWLPKMSKILSPKFKIIAHSLTLLLPG